MSTELPATLAKGRYELRVTVTDDGATSPIFTAPFQVGLTGPRLIYTAQPRAEVAPGSKLVYTLGFVNTTGSTLTDAVLTASLAPGVTLLGGSATCNGVVEANAVRWSLGELAAGAAVECSYAVTITGGAPTRWLTSQPQLTAVELLPLTGSELSVVVTSSSWVMLPLIQRN